MKAVNIFILMWIFNLGVGFIMASGIFPYNTASAESEMLQSAQAVNYSVTGTLDESQQFTTARTILSVFLDGVSFGWMFNYLPAAVQVQPNIVFMKNALFWFAMLINGLALIELFHRGSGTIVS